MELTTILALVIILLFITLGIYLGIKTKKKLDGNYKQAIDFDKIDGKSQLVKHVPYLWPKELEFYEIFASILPKEYIIISKVGVDKIVKPHGSLLLYNAIKTKYVDFCVFKKATMEPIMVIDCFYPSITDSSIKELEKPIQVALKAVEIPILKFEILDEPYDKAMLLKRFYDALDPVALAQLRKKEK